MVDGSSRSAFLRRILDPIRVNNDDLVTHSDKGTYGNRMCISDDSDATAEMILSHIEQAKSRVWIETYIFDGSDHARKFVDAMIAAKSRGCDVLLILDWVGSFDFNSSWVDEMRDCGIDVVFFNPLLPRVDGPFGMRDHRKIMVIDETGFCGSMNIMKEARSHEKGGFFTDFHARVEGPCVVDLANIMRETLQNSHSGVSRDAINPIGPICSCDSFWSASLPEVLTREKEQGHKLRFRSDATQGATRPSSTRPSNDFLANMRLWMVSRLFPVSSPSTVSSDSPSLEDQEEQSIDVCCPHCHTQSTHVKVLVSDIVRGRREIQQEYFNLIVGARRKIDIATAYFHPPGAIKRALLRARNSNNVEVNLVLSGGSDVPGDIIATEHTLRDFVRAGVCTWRTEREHMHAKTLLIDEQRGLIGSFNLDRLSYRRNMEVMLLFNNQQVAFMLQHLIDKRKREEVSERLSRSFLDQKPWLYRLYAFGAACIVKASGTNILDGLSNNGRRVLLLHFLVDSQASNHIAAGMAMGLS
eukprot:GDKJ01026874.1.p1 GENE.GDKJ01026874.1~~GDKJ01026874.1.p1  ORF type:complete len:527 (+),score=91.42 GDKJ01026874.1:35-1615(+)